MTDTPTPRDVFDQLPKRERGGTVVDDGGRPQVDDGGRPLTYDGPTPSDDAADQVEPMTVDSDPADFTVDQVNAYLDGDLSDVERDRVLDAERGNRGRVGILDR
jgi:hypothetical protein